MGWSRLGSDTVQTTTGVAEHGRVGCCAPTPIKLGVITEIRLELSENARIWSPFGLATIKRTIGIGMVAVMLAPVMSILTTAPGVAPVTAADGTAAKAVLSSVQTKTLWVAPGRVTAPETDSVALLTIASLPSDGLTTMVRSCFGVRTNIPASVTLPVSEDRLTRKVDSRSREASTMFSTGACPAPAGNTGLETNARSGRPLG